MRTLVQPPRRATLTALALTAGFAALAYAPAHAQSLNGQPVNVKYYFPDKATLPQDEGTQTVTPAGATFTNGLQTVAATITETVTPGQLTFTFPSTTVTVFTPTSFNGTRTSETGGSPVTITGVTLDPSSSLAGFDTSRFSFDATDVFANFKGLISFPGNAVTLDLSFAPAAVPEPAPALTFAVAALGIGGLMAVAARRKKASAAS